MEPYALNPGISYISFMNSGETPELPLLQFHYLQMKIKFKVVNRMVEELKWSVSVKLLEQ